MATLAALLLLPPGWAAAASPSAREWLNSGFITAVMGVSGQHNLLYDVVLHMHRLCVYTFTQSNYAVTWHHFAVQFQL